jgi:hypothetical protein
MPTTMWIPMEQRAAPKRKIFTLPVSGSGGEAGRHRDGVHRRGGYKRAAGLSHHVCASQSSRSSPFAKRRDRAPKSPNFFASQICAGFENARCS